VIQLTAPAKLTWHLEITGTRPNGYHELRSEMVTLGLADVIELDPEGDYLRIPGRDDVPTDERNLITKALRLVGRRAGVTLHKNIPAGGGLGGGSADAGAILRWAGGVSDEQALSLGGDVPFCQRGGRALVEGVGERLTMLAPELRNVTLLLPSFGVATAPVYAAYDELVAQGERPSGRNHLEAPARRVEPRLGVTMDWARATFGDVQLAGSGSTLFLEGHLDSSRTQWYVEGPSGSVHVVQTVTTP